MKRQALDNGTWFDVEQADKHEEDTYWNGNNHISRATGSQWNHEVLYRTASHRWVLNHWSQYQGSGETWEEIDNESAARWLVANGHDHPDAAEAIAALEV
jgi:hypothetical protein